MSKTQSLVAIKAIEIGTQERYLVVVDGPDAGKRFKLTPPSVVIGRADRADIVLNDGSISSIHCRVSSIGNRVFVEDLNSRNGSFVNGTQLERDPISLDFEGLLSIGHSSLRLACKTDREIAAEEAMVRRARNDALTGLLNRHHFMELAQRDLAFGVRQQVPISLFVIDIDHFKKVNDTYGHAAGDEVLRQLAQLLLEEVRTEDLVARWGGEEFVVLLRGYGPEKAQVAAERIRHRVQQSRFEVSETHLEITVSIGVFGCVPTQETQLTQLFIFADQALYKAKFDGRNQVSVAH